MKYNAKLHLNYFSVNVFVLAVVFRRQIKKARQFQVKLSVFLKIYRRNAIASMETFTTIKNAKKLVVFGENDSRCLSNF